MIETCVTVFPFTITCIPYLRDEEDTKYVCSDENSPLSKIHKASSFCVCIYAAEDVGDGYVKLVLDPPEWSDLALNQDKRGAVLEEFLAVVIDKCLMMSHNYIILFMGIGYSKGRDFRGGVGLSEGGEEKLCVLKDPFPPPCTMPILDHPLSFSLAMCQKAETTAIGSETLSKGTSRERGYRSKIGFLESGSTKLMSAEITAEFWSPTVERAAVTEWAKWVKVQKHQDFTPFPQLEVFMDKEGELKTGKVFHR
ncbi:hypothetical protein CDAR_97251 [Caerostris darwini]|uniref:Uncharacterized protein n=1 Tax=Caerostris darwini TaxID=1538125 RepID=A0AAV4QSU5_9ARAC|nr:hypothetical protein CDAR_97251 [Caerostris darwini]